MAFIYAAYVVTESLNAAASSAGGGVPQYVTGTGSRYTYVND